MGEVQVSIVLNHLCSYMEIEEEELDMLLGSLVHERLRGASDDRQQSSTLLELGSDILDLPLSRLHLSLAVYNKLIKEDVRTVGKLVEHKASGFRELKYSGQRGMMEIVTALANLEASIEGRTVNWQTFYELNDIDVIPLGFESHAYEFDFFGELPKLIKAMLSYSDDDRIWPILERRFGLLGTFPRTLEQLGVGFGITRERVRQIERQALIELRRVIFEDNYAGKKYYVHAQLGDRLKEAHQIVRDASSEGIKHSNLMDLIAIEFETDVEAQERSIQFFLELCQVTRIQLSRTRLDPIWTSNRDRTSRRIVRAVEAVDEVFSKDSARSMSGLDVMIEVNESLPKRERIDTDLLHHAIRLCSSVEQLEDGEYWIKFIALSTRTSQAERVLLERKRPMRIAAIAREINHRTLSQEKDARIVDANNLRNQMSADHRQRFTPIGRSGEWGLTRWSLEDSSIYELMREVLIVENRPLSSTEIHSRVNRRRPASQSSVSIYLQTRPDFKKVDRDSWALSTWKEAESAQVWNPRQVGEFVERYYLMRSTDRIPYRKLKQALIEETGYSPKQVQGLLNVNPAIRTEHDSVDSELVAIFQPGYRDVVEQGGARLTRRRETLRERVGKFVIRTLNAAPENRILVSELVSRLTKEFGSRKSTYYTYVSDLEDVERFIDPDTSGNYYRLVRSIEPKIVSSASNIQTELRRSKVKEALKYITVEDIDLALFLLGKEFEDTLKQYLLTAHNAGELPDLQTDRLNLNNMINVVEKARIVTDKSVLHYLREKRNERAHGTRPSLQEREILMEHAATTASMYVDYIRYFDDKMRHLQ